METEEKALADLILSIDAVHPPREAPLYIICLIFSLIAALITLARETFSHKGKVHTCLD